MRVVSRFEADLLQILRCLLGHIPLSQVLPMVVRVVERPACLGRDSVELIQQSLAGGTVHMLARGDGWQRERFLRDEQITDGRLWQRSRPEELGLEFSANSIDFLIWLTSVDPRKSRWRPSKRQAVTLGDQFLFFLAFQAMLNTDIVSRWSKRPLFQTNGLCALMFPNEFAELAVRPNADFAPWLSGPGAAILEAWQGRLADSWIELERGKAGIVSAGRMRLLGAAQEQVLVSFMDAAEQAGRRELTRFLFVVTRRLMSTSPSAESWTASLNVDGLRMADRMEIYRAAFAFLRQMRRLERWQTWARNVGYHDEDYAASQLWKADWERFEADTFNGATGAIIRQLEPLGGPAPAESAAE